jgi:hypothetical protein
MFADISGRRVLVEAIARRFETPRGSLFYDSDYGLDLRAYVGEGFDSSEVFELQASIEAECLKDERVNAARARVTMNAATGELRVLLSIEAGDGPFRFVLSVSDVSVAILNEGEQ